MRIGVSVCLLMVAVVAGAQDWASWRGPHGDSISDETGWNAEALASGAKTLWRVELGQGYSAVAIKGERLYTMGNAADQDTVFCLDPVTGKEIWRYGYPCKEGSYPGPRSTPVVHDASVYTMSREGQVYCFDASSGEVKWQTNVSQEHGAAVLRWGLAGSPVVEGKMLLLNAGKHGIALSLDNGSKVWSSGPGTAGYATPVLYTMGKQRGCALFGEKGLYGVDAQTGRQLWFHPWETRYDVNAADPVVSGSKIFISSGYDRGCALLDVAGDAPKVVWSNGLMRNHFSSSVLIDGHLYGIDGNAGKGALRCLNFETGTELWSKELGFGSLVVAGGKFIILNENGRLFVADASPAGYKELSSAETGLAAKCWTMPILCRGLIYCRNDKGSLVCVDVR